MISTFLLTVLLAIGLFFFIRASVKDRTEVITLVSPAAEDKILEHLQQYFQQRAYQVVTIDGEKNQVTLEGFVAPSLFLAIFLSFLAACGLFCLALVLSFLYPSQASIFLWLTLLAPVAGVFYWQKAGRLEQVALKLDSPTTQTARPESIITITAHRDELIELQKSFPFSFSIQ
jgi:Flp pilus assembly protein TadB